MIARFSLSPIASSPNPPGRRQTHEVSAPLPVMPSNVLGPRCDVCYVPTKIVGRFPLPEMRKFMPLFFFSSHYPVMNSHVYGGLPPTDYFCTGQPPVVDNPNLKSRSEMGWQAAVGGVWWCLVKRSPDTMAKNMAGRKVYIPIVFGVQNHMFQVFLAHYSAFNFEVCD